MSLPESRLSGILTDRYRIVRELGQGGMATVYLASDLKHDREVALKVLRPELGAVLGSERFLAEIKITARLDHPHILTLIDSGAVDGLLYYVLPYVRGESLRDLLNRETQLGIDQAIAIIRQVGSALDYAHRQGVVHRDIKPENILIQEGEAMLADFGIALAVKEAGGNRLTETGLSLGTPQYMSPEQATGDRVLDARSDVYSLGAVLYEMLTGEPPLTGANVQAVIAKLLTEAPTRIRIIRPSVPEPVDEAVARALAKVPADRYPTAGEFLTALVQPARATSGVMSAPAPLPRSRAGLVTAAVMAVAVLGAGAAFLMNRDNRPSSAPAALRDRTQLTFSGAVTSPALSEDGKQLAYFVKVCVDGQPCTWSVEVQDVGSTASRRVLDGVTAGYSLAWSPDRRNLLFFGTVGGRYGSHLVPILGGPARLVTRGAAAFYAGGDSLLLGSAGADSVFTVKFASLAGTVSDSVRIASPGNELGTLIGIPGSSRFVAAVIQGSRGLWHIVERDGKVSDRLLNTCTCGGVTSRDALWMIRSDGTATEAVVRVAVDPISGRFAARQDTLYSGTFRGLSVRADGSQLAVDDGSYSFTARTIPLAELLKPGAKEAGAAVTQASRYLSVSISPDGGRVLIVRSVAVANGLENRISVMSYPGGGAETPVTVAGALVTADWADSVTLATSAYTATGRRLGLLDIQTGALRQTIDVDSTLFSAVPLGAGWAWIPVSRDRVIIDEGGARREIPAPAWFESLARIGVAPDHGRLFLQGWGATQDTIGFWVVPAAGGEPVRWFTQFAERADARWLTDGTLEMAVWETEESAAVWRIRGPGQAVAIGRIAVPLGALSISGDGTRAAYSWREYRGDAWLYRVVTQ